MRQPGDLLLGRFRLLRSLGEDGPSASWLAEDAELGEHVLLRILASELDSSQLGNERFRQACREARRLNHPNIARVHDFHRGEGVCLLSREYVGGGGATAPGPPGPERARALASLVDAVAHAHGLGIVHGDLKASKVLWDANGAPRLADFRIAAELRSAARALGPPTDEPPPPEPSVKDDIRALRALLFELLSGSPLELDDPRSVSTRLLDSGVGAALADAIERMQDVLGDPSDLARVRAALDPDARAGLPPAPPRAPASAAPSGNDDPVIPVPVRAAVDALPPPLPTSAPTASHRPGRGIAVVFGLLVIVATAVVFFLPRWVGQRNAEPTTVESEEAAGGEPLSPAEPAASSEDAKRLLAEVLELQEQLDAQQVTQWAPAEMQQAQQQTEKGEKAQIAGDSARAAELLGRARDELDELADRVPVVLGETLAAGATALERGDDEGAVSHFELALAIEPGNADATAGLARAQRLDEVTALIASGTRYEADGKPAKARDAYARALEIDAESKRAREGLDRVTAGLAEVQYSQGMARATQALARGALGEALREIDSALQARPDSPEASTLRARIRSKQTQNAVARHMGNARRHESAREWVQAVAAYRAALAIDPELGVAQSGLARCDANARVASQLSAWIADPNLLLDPSRRAEAGSVVAEARNLPDSAQNLGAQIAEVERLLAAFSSPVTVVFESDNETEVTIQRLKKLGSFTRREVTLDPGTYVVTGIRRGYRDVRQTITVTPGRALSPVSVRCSKPI